MTEDPAERLWPFRATSETEASQPASERAEGEGFAARMMSQPESIELWEETVGLADLRPGRDPRGEGQADEEPAESDPLLGSVLGHYRIKQPLGQGSMARVYKARHLGLRRVCALKVMDREIISRQPAIREQFSVEARAAANLVHPYIVTVHNLGSDRGYDYIEMEYVPGAMSLREALVRDGPFEPTRASRLVRQVVLALCAAHRAGLVHRDVKPANVLLTPHGHAKLADFGLVRRIDDESVAGGLAGTPTFMAPELFSGAPASPQSDIYAVGVMLYYLLSARLPFASDRIGTLIRLHRQEPVPDIGQYVEGIPCQVRSVIDRCLAKSPTDRYQTASELADDLRMAITRMRGTESLVRESVQGLGGFLLGGRDQYRVILNTPHERLHEVMIEVKDGSRGRLLSVYSLCAPADPAHYAKALELNGQLTFGSISIREVGGIPMFVMSRTFPRDQVRPFELREAIREIALHADQIERELTSLDQY
jgi:serine/threonine protein kinase